MLALVAQRLGTGYTSDFFEISDQKDDAKRSFYLLNIPKGVGNDALRNNHSIEQNQ